MNTSSYRVDRHASTVKIIAIRVLIGLAIAGTPMMIMYAWKLSLVLVAIILVTLLILRYVPTEQMFCVPTGIITVCMLLTIFLTYACLIISGLYGLVTEPLLRTLAYCAVPVYIVITYGPRAIRAVRNFFEELLIGLTGGF